MRVNKLVALLLFLAVPLLVATKYPHVPFIVEGSVFDWDTKAPLANVRVMVFLNDAPYTDNNGWVGDYDYPNIPVSDKHGKLTGRTRLYRADPEIEVKKVEIIAFRDGYRTERFVFGNPKFTRPKGNAPGVIEIPRIFLLATRQTKN